MNIKDQIKEVLLCAVRYRDPMLVQMILDHPDAKNLKAADLKNALAEANEANEMEIASALKDKKGDKCVVS